MEPILKPANKKFSYHLLHFLSILSFLCALAFTGITYYNTYYLQQSAFSLVDIYFILILILVSITFSCFNMKDSLRNLDANISQMKIGGSPSETSQKEKQEIFKKLTIEQERLLCEKENINALILEIEEKISQLGKVQ